MCTHYVKIIIQSVRGWLGAVLYVALAIIHDGLTAGELALFEHLIEALT